MLLRPHIAILFAALAAQSGQPASSQSDEIAVIAHPSVADTLDADTLTSIFTVRTRRWSNGDRVIPFNLRAGHPLRTRFDRTVNHMSPDEVASFWIDRRIRGGGRPPREVRSPQLVLRVVATLEGSIGYVPRHLVTSNVRVVAIVRGDSVVIP